MEQILLSKVQERISQIENMEKIIKSIQKQISKKEEEIKNFYQEWQNNCHHVFYRLQRLVVSVNWTYSTIGYHCCLCGKFQEAKYKKVIPHSRRQQNEFPRKISPTSLDIPDVTEIDAPNFIGTVKSSILSKEEENPYPIPPEYQAEVDGKIEQLSKLKNEEAALKKRLESLKSDIDSSKAELNEIAHYLNGYFGYPEIVYEEKHHWTPDDFNYDG